MKDTLFSSNHTIRVEGKLISLDKPLLMGILNTTPDSFFDGGKYKEIDFAIVQTEKMLSEGAAIIDIGGYSTRPGNEEVSEAEEIRRVVPIIQALKKRFPEIVISIDTFRPMVAKQAIDSGAAIINDISGDEFGKGMIDMAGYLNVPYILTHNKGKAQTMHQSQKYENLQLEIIRFFAQKIAQLRKEGVHDIILDPGFGFAKDIEQNYLILSKLQSLQLLELPILVGVSRKSMIYKLLDSDAKQSLNATTALHMYSLMQGAKILRVHDVKEAFEAVTLFNKLQSID